MNSCLLSKIADFKVSALIPKQLKRLIWYKQLFLISSKLADFEVSAPHKHLMWYKQLFAI